LHGVSGGKTIVLGSDQASPLAGNPSLLLKEIVKLLIAAGDRRWIARDLFVDAVSCALQVGSDLGPDGLDGIVPDELSIIRF